MTPGAHLAVVGRGAYERELRRLAVRLGVEHAVTFTAFDSADRTGLGTLIHSSDVVALLSEYEAHPVALMEALALGRKVVVAATSGLTELAQAGIVTTVPLDAHPAALAAVLARVAQGPEASACEFRTWDDCANDVMRVYDHACEARS
jgi:glycosyltransferase involved in cell wall biosynthesis